MTHTLQVGGPVFSPAKNGRQADGNVADFTLNSCRALLARVDSSKEMD